VIPHAELETVNGSFKNLDRSLKRVMEHPGVMAASPYITLNGLLQKDDQMKALQIRAIAPETESNVTTVEQFIKKGGWELLEKGQRSIILGKSVALKLAVNIGDSLTLLLPPQNGQHLKSPRKIQLKLVALFEMGGQLDNVLGFMHIEDAKQFLTMDSANGIAFKVADVLNAQILSREVGYSLNDYVYIKSWITSQGYLYEDIQMVKSLMYVILLLVIAVACFNIVSTLVMAVNEKRGDIAILKTMGASKWMLRGTFIVQGAFNGFIGCILGALSGIYLAQHLTGIIKFIENIIGHKFLSGDIYFIDFLPSHLIYEQVAAVTIVAFMMSILSTVYPAWRASNIQPAQELGFAH